MHPPQVIVVGSGPAGVSVAWPLVRAGIRVLMIDASNMTRSRPPKSHSLEEFRLQPERWKDRFGADLAGLASEGDASPKLTMPRPRAVLDDFTSRSAIATKNFLATGSLACGGLSEIWGALVEPFQPGEFAAFPFDAAALSKSYKAIARRIGVSTPEATALTSEPARILLKRYLRRGGGQNGFTLRPATNAVLDVAREGREPCSQSGLCLYGCSRNAIYNSAFEIPALQRFANFSYASDHHVRAIESENGEHVLDVEATKARRTLRAGVVILAAGTLSTTSLALRRLNWTERPVRLLTNPAAAAVFLMPALIGRDPPGRAFSLGQLLYRVGGVRGDAVGVMYGADGLPLDLIAARFPVSRPFALRLVHALAPALVITTAYLPGSFSDNTLRVHATGAPTLTIEGRQTDEANAELRRVVTRLRREMLPLRAMPLPGSLSILQPGGDAHYAGTLPMGGDSPIATNEYGELRNCPGLFVADGACLPSLPATHPTLTIMANADRIGGEIARLLQSHAEPNAFKQAS